jgi:hypothetical protein
VISSAIGTYTLWFQRGSQRVSGRSGDPLAFLADQNSTDREAVLVRGGP